MDKAADEKTDCEGWNDFVRIVQEDMKKVLAELNLPIPDYGKK